MLQKVRHAEGTLRGLREFPLASGGARGLGGVWWFAFAPEVAPQEVPDAQECVESCSRQGLTRDFVRGAHMTEGARTRLVRVSERRERVRT